MTAYKAQKHAAREYARANGVSYTSALRQVSQGGRRVIPTGMTALDRLLRGGFTPGGLTAVWSATGVGTSMFGLTVARSAARSAHKTWFVGLEDPRNIYFVRLMAAETGIPFADIGRTDEGRAILDLEPDWAPFFQFYGDTRLPMQVGDFDRDMRAFLLDDLAPELVVIDDLDCFIDEPDDSVPVLAALASDLRTAIVVLQPLPSSLCRRQPDDPDEVEHGYDSLFLSWPERVPDPDELAVSPWTRALWTASSAAVNLATPDSAPTPNPEVTVLDLTVYARSRSNSGRLAVRRDGPRARFLPGAG